MTEQQFQLEMERGPEPGLIFELTLPSHTVGRDPISDLCISDPEVSRQHALLILTPQGGYKIQDLGSTNGTLVDGSRLSGEAHRLEPGQLISMGASVALRYALAAPEGGDPEEVDSEGPAVQPAETPLPTSRDASNAMGYDEVDPSDQETDLAHEAEMEQWAAGRSPLRESAPEHLPVSEQPASPHPAPLATDFTELEDGDAEPDPARRILSIALGVLLVLLCLCCSLTVFMYYFGGDWLLRQFGVVP